MKKLFLLAYLLLVIEFCTPKPESAVQSVEYHIPVISPKLEEKASAPMELELLIEGQPVKTDMQTYLKGVLAAEMPASFPVEALKAQAVAARSYAMYCLNTGKHGAALCPDPGCCQAWQDEKQQREKWGEDYDVYAQKISSAVEETDGEYLSYQGQAIFAAFHSSSAGFTEDSSALWQALPYLVSVESPESSKDVPNYVSHLECSAIDFRDSVLHLKPEADFTAEPENWIGKVTKSPGGRVDKIVLGGVEMEGEDIRSLFSLRSTAFELEYQEGKFCFTVTGYGHGIGMSQYGAKHMAEKGSDYRSILAHYYPDTYLS